MTCLIQNTTLILSLRLQMTLPYALEVKKAAMAAHSLQEDLDALMKWCTKWRIKLNPEKTKLIRFSRSIKETSEKSALGYMLLKHPVEKILISFLGTSNTVNFIPHERSH